MRHGLTSAVVWCFFTMGLSWEAWSEGPKPFVIRVVDEATGRGVPLVELRTTAATRHLSDSQGVVAFHEPGWMGRRVFFYVVSDGYELAPDGFGFRGRALQVEEGGEALLSVRRTMIAERLYRVTGAGIYRDSVLAGLPVPIRHPLLNAGVVGSDSVINAIYNGKLYWFWGDTNRTEYPLGNFHVPGATSNLPSAGGLDPNVGVDLDYFTDQENDFAKETARMPGEGPTWINGLVVLQDENGQEGLWAAYVKVKPPLDVYQHGLCHWNDQRQQFEPAVVFPENAPLYPTGHPWIARFDGKPYVLFTDPVATVRCPATAKALTDLDAYEAYTCLEDGSVVEAKGALPRVDRGAAGEVQYRWRARTSPMRPDIQQRLVAAHQLKPHEALIQLRDRDSGKQVFMHSGGIAWNAYRQRWISVFVQAYGESFLGEVWYAEADAPWGPWVYTVKIASHARYSFYNPKLHPYFDQQQGRRVFFEGTYSHSFSGNPEQKPWYDYNQIMYGLQLDDPRLTIPVAFYPTGEMHSVVRPWNRSGDEHLEAAPQFSDFQRIAFFAWDQPNPAAVALCLDQDGRYQAVASPPSNWQVIGYILPADTPNKPENAVRLYARKTVEGRETLVTSQTTLSPHDRLLGWVWPNPYHGSP